MAGKMMKLNYRKSSVNFMLLRFIPDLRLMREFFRYDRKRKAEKSCFLGHYHCLKLKFLLI